MKQKQINLLNFKNSEKIGRSLLVHNSKKALKSEKLLTMSRHHLFQNSDVIKFNGKFLAIAEGGDQIFSVKQASIQKQYP
jgi:hypothetical protein